MPVQNDLTNTQPPISVERAELAINVDGFRAAFNREPIAFSHNLHYLKLFELNYLRRLAESYAASGTDYYLAGGAPLPGTRFYGVPKVTQNLQEMFGSLDSGSFRILLKRPEKYDPQFRRLLDHLFEQVIALKGGLGSAKVQRLEAAILISSGSTITPLHFDPEAGFFSQIEGEKFYHVYSPSDLKEQELERFYRRGVIDIAQIAIDERNPEKEHVFNLAPGKGMHQPLNAPHWVQTGNARSISYTFVFNTDADQVLGRTRAFNHYMRRLRLNPAMPGADCEGDARKARVMSKVLPVRVVVENQVSKIGGPVRRVIGKFLRKRGLYVYYKRLTK